MSLAEDDPSIVFTGTSGGTSVTFSGSSSPTAQRVHVAQLVAPIGPMLEVGFAVSAATGGGTIEMALSIELIGRTA